MWSIFNPINCMHKISITGSNLYGLDNERGGHRVQRIPSTEKRGRVHTSLITVAVIDPELGIDESFASTQDSDFSVEWFSGTGAGGQHRNKTQNCCRLTHIPTGIIESQQGRRRESNYRSAMTKIVKRISDMQISQTSSAVSCVRREQVGRGFRNEKIRTYKYKSNVVIDHNTNKSAKCNKVLKGHFPLLW